MAYSPWFWSDFGSFSHLFQRSCIIYLDPFWTILDQKAWPIAHGFGPILGHFHTFFKDYDFVHFNRFGQKASIFGHFGFSQKAWPMAYSPWFWSDFGSFSHLFQIDNSFDFII